MHPSLRNNNKVLPLIDDYNHLYALVDRPIPASLHEILTNIKETQE